MTWDDLPFVIKLAIAFLVFALTVHWAGQERVIPDADDCAAFGKPADCWKEWPPRAHQPVVDARPKDVQVRRGSTWGEVNSY